MLNGVQCMLNKSRDNDTIGCQVKWYINKPATQADIDQRPHSKVNRIPEAQNPQGDLHIIYSTTSKYIL